VRWDLDLVKTLGATAIGTGNVLLDIDIALKVLISLVSLVYVCTKTYDLYKNR
jgi:hypothetical protein